MDQLKKLLGIFCAAALAFLFSGTALAADILLQTPATTFGVGDTISVPVVINTGNSPINAVDLTVLYPSILRVKNIVKSGSNIQLWVKEPSYTDSAIFLSGGTPGGLMGSRVVVATIVFAATAVGDGQIGLAPNSTVLLNDGSGTPAAVTLHTSVLSVVPRKASQAPKAFGTATMPRAEGDVIPPAAFAVSVGQDARLFGGKYFASFFSTDAGSGIDHYEIKEGNGPFTLARSPFLLSDQTLHSVIRVRAYDVAGNYRETAYPNIFIRFWWWITGLFRRH